MSLSIIYRPDFQFEFIKVQLALANWLSAVFHDDGWVHHAVSQAPMANTTLSSSEIGQIVQNSLAIHPVYHCTALVYTLKLKAWMDAIMLTV